MMSPGSTSRRRSEPGGARRRLLSCLVLASLLIHGVPAGGAGSPLDELMPAGGSVTDHRDVQGLDGFANWEFVLEIGIALIVSALLGAAIAYHPRVYGKAATLEEFDQPKIFIQYAVVGAVIAEIVRRYPEMALAVFGIGGLLRFRTDVGPARDTGRVILVTIVGMSCGLKLYVISILATVLGWVLIWLLERRVTHRVVIKGLEPSLLAQSAEAYQEVLRENGLSIMSQKKNFNKGQVAFVFRAPGGVDREELESLFKDIPPKLQGAADWESK